MVGNAWLLGECYVESCLKERGWHAVRLDTGHMAMNADLAAIKNGVRVSLQIKTTDARKAHSHAGYLFFGHAAAFLRDGTPIFNAKESPLVADVVVGVSLRPSGSRFVVVPVVVAEQLSRLHATYWSSVPRLDAGKRSDAFPIYLCFTAEPGAHREHHERIKQNLIRYENAWEVLNEPIDKLHAESAWPLLD
jgi:hypothetical protein